MKRLVRALVQRAVPQQIFTPWMASRSRKHQVHVLRTLGIEQVSNAFIARYGLQVRYGPFGGMRYTAEAARNRVIVPKLLGTYESELHEIIRYVQKADYDVIVDVGCAEGFYATGLAKTTPARVVAFDAERNELDLARGMAEANGVTERIELRDWCSPEELIRIAAGARRAFVLSDCEGYETTLFSEEVVAALKRSDVLIELHGSAKSVLVERFEGTHAIELISFEELNRGSCPELDGMSVQECNLALTECRAQQEWLWAKRKGAL